MKAKIESPELSINGCVKDPIQIQSDVLFSIIISHGYVLPILLQVIGHYSVVLLEGGLDIKYEMDIILPNNARIYQLKSECHIIIQ